MKVTFNLSAEFRRHFKRLAKKYPSLVNDYDTFKKELCKNPFQGADLGGGTHKVRMAIASKGKEQINISSGLFPCLTAETPYLTIPNNRIMPPA